MGRLLTDRPSEAEAIRRIERGLAWADAVAVAEVLGLTLNELAYLLDIPQATFYRRRRLGGRLTRQESDRLVRFARLWWLACDVFEGEGSARGWLGSPQFGLSGAVPLEHARTEVGARQVEDLLRRIDHGVLA